MKGTVDHRLSRCFDVDILVSCHSSALWQRHVTLVSSFSPSQWSLQLQGTDVIYRNRFLCVPHLKEYRRREFYSLGSVSVCFSPLKEKLQTFRRQV